MEIFMNFLSLSTSIIRFPLTRKEVILIVPATVDQKVRNKTVF